MPELPEVEITTHALKPACEGKVLGQLRINRRDLRWAVSEALPGIVLGQRCFFLSRRGKYIIFHFSNGAIIAHLGMSGSFRLCKEDDPWRQHEHIQMVFEDCAVRLHDPRRFGCFLWAPVVNEHPLIINIGPEPLMDEFNSEYLAQKLEYRSSPIKNCIMDSKLVCGVGNIYANESLFQAQIHPLLPASRLKDQQRVLLVQAIKNILKSAIVAGGCTLKDFESANQQPGYFQTDLAVYGRKNLHCYRCVTPLMHIRISGRSTVYCPSCQKL